MAPLADFPTIYQVAAEAAEEALEDQIPAHLVEALVEEALAAVDLDLLVQVLVLDRTLHHSEGLGDDMNIINADFNSISQTLN